MILPASGGLLQRIDPQRRLRLGQRLVEWLARFLGQCLQVARLRPGDRLVAGRPVMGIFLSVDGVACSDAVLFGFVVMPPERPRTPSVPYRRYGSGNIFAIGRFTNPPGPSTMTKAPGSKSVRFSDMRRKEKPRRSPARSPPVWDA